MTDKFVFIKHQGPGFYLFRVPENIELFAGDKVICDTRRGQNLGMCICDSFITDKGEDVIAAAGVSRSMLRDIVGFNGGMPHRKPGANIPEDVDIRIDEILF